MIYYFLYKAEETRPQKSSENLMKNFFLIMVIINHSVTIPIIFNNSLLKRKEHFPGRTLRCWDATRPGEGTLAQRAVTEQTTSAVSFKTKQNQRLHLRLRGYPTRHTENKPLSH